MTVRVQQCVASPPSGRWRALLVLGLLAGLFGMHGLAPGGGMVEHSAARHMTVATAACAGCHGDQNHGGGHVHHADQTCASGALDRGPVLPAPVADPVTAPDRADVPCPYADQAPDGARAPPSLSELQLLRI